MYVYNVTIYKVPTQREKYQLQYESPNVEFLWLVMIDTWS
jgi:hypothetical protein